MDTWCNHGYLVSLMETTRWYQRWKSVNSSRQFPSYSKCVSLNCEFHHKNFAKRSKNSEEMKVLENTYNFWVSPDDFIRSIVQLYPWWEFTDNQTAPIWNRWFRPDESNFDYLIIYSNKDWLWYVDAEWPEILSNIIWSIS